MNIVRDSHSPLDKPKGLVKSVREGLKYTRLTEDEVADLRRALRGIIRRLDQLENSALASGRVLIGQSRERITASTPAELTPTALDPFLGTIRTSMQSLAGDTERLVQGFAIEGANLGEEFGLAQMRALGITPEELGPTGLSADRIRQMSRAAAAEAQAVILDASAKLQGEIARVFLKPKPTQGELAGVLKASLSTRRKGGGFSGAIAKVATNLRTTLGQFFSMASDELQRKAAEKDKNLRKIWVTKGDAKVRNDHNIAGSKFGRGGNPGPIPVKKRFKVGSASLRFPRDPDGKGGSKAVKAQVINCRCDSVLVRIEPKK